MSFSRILLTTSTIILTSLLMFAVPTAFQRNRDIEDKAKLEGSMAAMKEVAPARLFKYAIGVQL